MNYDQRILPILGEELRKDAFQPEDKSQEGPPAEGAHEPAHDAGAHAAPRSDIDGHLRTDLFLQPFRRHLLDERSGGVFLVQPFLLFLLGTSGHLAHQPDQRLCHADQKRIVPAVDDGSRPPRRKDAMDLGVGIGMFR